MLYVVFKTSPKDRLGQISLVCYSLFNLKMKTEIVSLVHFLFFKKEIVSDFSYKFGLVLGAVLNTY